MFPIYHLCYGPYVFEHFGWNHDYMRYVYVIKGNMGDIYKVTGTSGLLGKLVFDRQGNYSIEITEEGERLCNLSEMDYPIKLIVNNYRENQDKR